MYKPTRQRAGASGTLAHVNSQTRKAKVSLLHTARPIKKDRTSPSDVPGKTTVSESRCVCHSKRTTPLPERFFSAQMMFLVVSQASRLQDNEWARLYERLIKTKCPYDERTQSHVGKLRVIGRIAGQMIETMDALLKRDAEILSRVPPGEAPPPSLLYDPEVHRKHTFNVTSGHQLYFLYTQFMT